ncbi:MAG: sugar nucleotide-binding protein, partial [Candidatus Marinimicrobia bacterium]|nr:sugar nucleotide-binding protein [Candidatus Neomarinimicrobiota bacterium]
MKILITGANGMLGEKCVRLLAKQYSILATDLADNLIYDCAVSYRKMDITDPYEVKAIVSDF